MKKTLLLFLLLLSGCLYEPQIGDIIHPSVGEFGARGTCIGYTENYKTCSFSVSIYEIKSIQKLVTSLKFVSMEADGKPTWKIIDAIALPKDLDNRFVEIGTCRYNGKPDDSIVAVVNSYDQNSPEHIRAHEWAFKVDLPSGNFVAINANVVDCINTAIGAD